MFVQQPERLPVARPRGDDESRVAESRGTRYGGHQRLAETDRKLNRVSIHGSDGFDDIDVQTAVSVNTLTVGVRPASLPS
jgi:hypothetical protein